jgi:NhaP-type Na+/H+ or K+/H+ antiporter
MLTATLLLVGVVLVAMCLAERHVTRLPLSPATVYLVVGWIAGAMVRPHMRVPPTSPQHADMLVILTEGALLISLFAVGLRLRVPRTVKGWRIAVTLASSAMLATIAMAGTVAVFLLPELGLAGALLLAAILAPTDPVLASEVQIRSPTDRDALRVSLTAEGGLNDATASPIVMLGLGLAGLVPLGAGGLHWAWHDLVWPIAGGAALGWLFGRVLGAVVHALLRRGHGLEWDELLYLGIIMLAYGLARLTGTSAFLLVFTAALGPLLRFRTLEGSAEDDGTRADRAALAERLGAFGERCGRLVEVAMVLMLGLAMAWIEWRWQIVAFAALLAGVLRPVAVYACVPPAALPAPQRRLVAWFGIRGVGSLFYLAWVIDAGAPEPLVRGLVNATLPAIALSIVLHGVSATPLMGRYRRWRVLQRREKRRAAATAPAR